MSIPTNPPGTYQPGAVTANVNRATLRVDLFVDPACWWSSQTYQWLVQVAPLRHLDVHLRPYSLLLRNGPDGLEDWKAEMWGASLRAVRVMQTLDDNDPDGLHRFYQALVADGLATFRAGRPPFADLDAALTSAGLPSGYAAAAADASFDEPIRRSMAEASAAVGDGVGTPALVLHSDRSVGVLGPVISGPTTAAEAVRVWDAVQAFTTVPALFELSRPRPAMPPEDVLKAVLDSATRLAAW